MEEKSNKFNVNNTKIMEFHECCRRINNFLCFMVKEEAVGKEIICNHMGENDCEKKQVKTHMRIMNALIGKV